MAELVVTYMANHGTRFLRPCVPIRVEKNNGNMRHVTWKNTESGEEVTEAFDTVLCAIGELPKIVITAFSCEMDSGKTNPDAS